MVLKLKHPLEILWQKIRFDILIQYYVKKYKCQ